MAVLVRLYVYGLLLSDYGLFVDMMFDLGVDRDYMLKAYIEWFNEG